MKKNVIEFFNKRFLQPYKVVQKGKLQGLVEKKIRAAMIHCYYKIKDEDKVIPDIELARYVFNVARDATAADYEKEILALEEYMADARKWRIAFYVVASTLGIVLGSIIGFYLYLRWDLIL